jgi:alanine-synthesizing transaminase
MSTEAIIPASSSLQNVRYEILGRLAQRARELEQQGQQIIALNIGDPAMFGLPTPDSLRAAMVEHLPQSDGYCHQKGVLAAREAVVLQQLSRGVQGVNVEQVFIGSGVSELIDLALRALLNDGDEVLVPSPDYPLWTAAVHLNRGRTVHYPCRPENAFIPDPTEVEALLTDRTRALVVINPNNPSGMAYPRSVLEALARLAERRGLIVFSDEIYDGMVYDGAESIPMATLVHDALCVTLSGLSKIYRACGYRVGWGVFSGRLTGAQEYLDGFELLVSMRLCSNTPAQWLVPTALKEHPGIEELLRPGGRLYESRRVVIEETRNSRYLRLKAPNGAMYAFIGVDTGLLPQFNDDRFALDLLEQQQVLVAAGSSFNVPYRSHFRVTTLPQPEALRTALRRIETLLDTYARRPGANGSAGGARRPVAASSAAPVTAFK